MNIIRFLSDVLLYTSPILFCTVGGLFAYRANIVNIGLEGMMYFGGLASVLAIFFTQSLFLGIIVGMVISAAIGVLFSYFSVNKNANFIITGLGINLLATAAGKYILVEMGLTEINLINIDRVVDLGVDLPLIGRLPFLGGILSGHTPFTYLSLLAVFAAWAVLYRTPVGVYVRVCGDNEDAGVSLGIPTAKIKYFAVILGAVFCGFAGYNVTVEQLASFTPSFTDGIGFIAIAAIYCGDGKPLKSSLYAFLFGAAKSLAINLAVTYGSIAILLKMIPYLAIVVVLFAVEGVKHSRTNIRGISHV